MRYSCKKCGTFDYRHPPDCGAPFHFVPVPDASWVPSLAAVYSASLPQADPLPYFELVAGTEEDSGDTERPPESLGRCYWCDNQAVERVHGMPSCEECKQRAVGRRNRKR